MWKVMHLGSAVAILGIVGGTTPSIAQSEATCIAYMEADAIYKEREKEAKRASKEAGADLRKLLTESIGPHVFLMLSSVPSYERHIVLKDMLRDLPESKSGPIVDAIERINTIQDEILEQAQIERDDAYSNAYKGSTSKIPSVMNKLIKEDRTACKFIYG